jgi:Transposase DDE domain
MAQAQELSQWTETVTRELPHLSPAQARVLAWWSYGIVLTQGCGCPTIATFLGLLLGKGYEAMRQCLREWCYDAEDKKGLGRREVVVTTCFAPLLGWVLRHWSGRRLALALDATSLSDCFVVLTISVVFRGCAIPVAWKILPAQEQHAWRREWLVLLRLLHPAIPADWAVIVLADRGLYARWLFRRIVRLGWHPFLRINIQGTFHPTGSDRRRTVRALVPHVGRAFAGPGVAFTGPQSRLPCTLLACWEQGYKDPWAILTDLPSTACAVQWYGIRGWIEQGFKTLKRGGWQWQHTRMTDPARAERLWLALAVATFWVVTVGAATEVDTSQPVIAGLAPTPTRPRRIRLFRLGRLSILAALSLAHALPLPGPLTADHWPGDPCLPPAPLASYLTTSSAA